MPTQAFVDSVSSMLPSQQICTDEMLVRANSLDASPFEPRASMLVDVTSEDELQSLLALARAHKAGLTFRGSCTGLNGQAVGKDVMVRFRGAAWKRILVAPDARTVAAGTGAIGIDINDALALHGRKIGPDPSSISVATMGGMAANNSTGMCCTVAQNIFHTMTGIRFMLADGTVVDTRDPASVDAFRDSHANLLLQIESLRRRIVDNPALKARVQSKYAIRNTSGYSLNAFVEYHDPLDILAHLMIGSEGTLGCILDISLETLPLAPLRGTSLMLFPDLTTAASAITRLSHDCPAHAAEIMDRMTLKATEPFPDTPEYIAALDDKACAVLIETRAKDEEELQSNISAILERLEGIPTLRERVFTTDNEECEKLWNIRRSLNPAFAGASKPDEFTVSEDWCVPPDRLAEAAATFQDILEKHGFHGGIHGHAFHGNLHFIVPVRLGDPQSVKTFHSLTNDIVDAMLTRFHGSLKAEHGTGRSIAPYVPREWGEELYGVMQQLKKLLDPDGILNPEILLNEDPQSHVTNLQQPVALHETVDLCGGCGFCELLCPSREVGLSPRQRIYVARTIARLRASGDNERAAKWEASFKQYGIDLCATDGLCHMRCPLGVDVASYIRHLRHQSHGALANTIAGAVGSNFTITSKTASAMVTAGALAERALGAKALEALNKGAWKVLGKPLPNLVDMHLTGGSAIRKPKKQKAPAKVVYFPSCAVRTMGYSSEHKDADGAPVRQLVDITLKLLERAGYEVVFPKRMSSLCCGKAFESKGLMEEADAKAHELSDALYTASIGGAYPVLCDTSPCLARMRKTLYPAMELLEPVEFVLKHLQNRLHFTKLDRTIAVHPTCSIRSMGLTDSLVALASRCASTVVVPKGINCCGFAGDKGFTHPQVNASALSTLAEQVADCSEGYSVSRTCEAGLTLHSGKPYRNILYLIEESTRP